MKRKIKIFSVELITCLVFAGFLQFANAVCIPCYTDCLTTSSGLEKQGYFDCGDSNTPPKYYLNKTLTLTSFGEVDYIYSSSVSDDETHYNLFIRPTQAVPYFCNTSYMSGTLTFTSDDPTYSGAESPRTISLPVTNAADAELQGASSGIGGGWVELSHELTPTGTVEESDGTFEAGYGDNSWNYYCHGALISDLFEYGVGTDLTDDTDSMNASGTATLDSGYETDGSISRTSSVTSEYTDDDLLSDVVTIMPAYSTNWASGSPLASSTISDDHVTASAQKVKYRFKLPPRTQTNTTYLVTWDIITTLQHNGSTNITTQVNTNNSETINGTGDPVNYVYGVEHEILPPPFCETATNGGTSTMFVANVNIQISSGSGGNQPGSGPGNGPGNTGSGGSGYGCGCAGHDGGLLANFNLGNGLYGVAAGNLRIWAAAPSTNLATVSDLVFVGDTNNVNLITSSGIIQQAMSQQALANIETLNPYAYQIDFYYANQVGALSGGFYSTNGLTNFVSWLVQNPNTNNCNSLQITETRGSLTWVYYYIYNPTNNSWTYISPGGIRQMQLITTQNSDGTRTLSGSIGQTNGAVAQVFSRTYAEFSWGEGVVSETDGSGTTAKTTTKTYYDDGSSMPASGTFVPLQQVVNPDGSWQYYDYTQLLDGTWVTQDVYSGFGDSQANGTYSGTTGQYRQTQYSYSPVDSTDDGTQAPQTPRTVVVTLNGIEISRSYAVLSPGKEIDVQCTKPGVGWTDPSNLVTTNTYYTSGPSLYRLQSVAYPDGTLSIYSYVQSTNGWQTNTVCIGAPGGSGTNIIDGTQTTTVIDPLGTTVSIVAQDIASSATLQQDVYGNFDGLDRAQLLTHLDGTSNTFDYACCYLEDTVDSDGVLTGYIYDEAKRRIGYEKFYNSTNAIAWTNALDAVGHVVQAVRVGTDGSAIVLSDSGYDTVGRLIAQTNALGGPTTYLESTNSLGALVRTATNSDGGIDVQRYFLDGTLKSDAGTAVHGKAYAYGAGIDTNGNNCTYTIVNNLDTNCTPTSEWTETFTDMAGRTTEILYADGSYSQMFYNSLGQLTNSVDPDGVSTLYAYDARGRQVCTAINIDRAANINYDSNNRITLTTNDVVIDHGTTVQRSQTYGWLSGSPVLLSKTETSADGLNAWQTRYRDAGTPVETHRQTVPGISRTVTTTNPDGSYTLSSYSYGRLVSSFKYDSTGAQVGGTAYGYDAHGRQNTITDARNGTTTMVFNNADLISTNISPNPGSGSPEVTTTAYDSNLRPISIIQPDGGVVTSQYLLTGELGLQYGSRTYPVGYGYDYAGRMKTMTNWSNYGSGLGVRVTTWNYDGQRGWLTNKAYADGNGPSYSYTPAGRLASRVWVRGITTSYNYDTGGSLTNVLYSDTNTPSVAYAYDQLGRQSTVTWGGITDTLSYNLANQLLGESYSGGILNGLAVTNGYDADLRRTMLTALASSSQLLQDTYGYDSASRLSTVSDGNNNSATYSYLANSPLVSQITFKNGSSTRMTTSKQYDYLNRLTQISSVPSASGVLPFTYKYTYNAANQRTQDTLTDGSYWQYGYDSLGQVTNGSRHFAGGTPVAGQQFGYAFDTIGNRTQTQTGGDQTGNNLRVANYSANNLNQITRRDVPPYVDIQGASLLTNAVTINGQTAYRNGEYFRAQIPANNTNSALWTNIVVAGGQSVTGNVFVAQEPETFQYDADGNLTNDGRWAYVWDGENRLVQMTVNTNVGPQYTLTFGYDYQGRRIQKVVSTNGVAIYTNRFLYDGWNLAAVVNSGGAAQNTFMWGADLSGSMQGAGGAGGLLESSCQGTNGFIAYDGNGNVVSLLNANNDRTLAWYEYGPFGEKIRRTGSEVNPILYSSKYYDKETHLLYYGYRYYKPDIGAWIARDPLGENGGVNMYSFTKNNMINHIDKDGRIIVSSGSVNLAGYCGESHASWIFYCSSGYQEGYIVQQVDISTTVETCHVGPPYNKHQTYWEAWPVTMGFPGPDPLGTPDSDYSDTPAYKQRKGNIDAHGTIKFFLKTTTGDLGGYNRRPTDPANSDWYPDASAANDGYHSGVLPSTNEKPKWWDNPSEDGGPEGTRDANVSWDCCCQETKSKLTVSP